MRNSRCEERASERIGGAVVVGDVVGCRDYGRSGNENRDYRARARGRTGWRNPRRGVPFKSRINEYLHWPDASVLRGYT